MMPMLTFYQPGNWPLLVRRPTRPRARQLLDSLHDILKRHVARWHPAIRRFAGAAARFLSSVRYRPPPPWWRAHHDMAWMDATLQAVLPTPPNGPSRDKTPCADWQNVRMQTQEKASLSANNTGPLTPKRRRPPPPGRRIPSTASSIHPSIARAPPELSTAPSQVHPSPHPACRAVAGLACVCCS